MKGLSTFIPKFKSASLPRLAPAKLAIFRSVVTHPPVPYSSTTPGSIGVKQIIYSTSPRPLIPLTISPQNHRLWNPPAADALGSRVVERDESGRLAKFANRFNPDTTQQEQEQEKLFAPEADLSFLEGETLQSPAKALGKRDIIGKSSTTKKGKK